MGLSGKIIKMSEILSHKFSYKRVFVNVCASLFETQLASLVHPPGGEEGLRFDPLRLL